MTTQKPPAHLSLFIGALVCTGTVTALAMLGRAVMTLLDLTYVNSPGPLGEELLTGVLTIFVSVFVIAICWGVGESVIKCYWKGPDAD